MKTPKPGWSREKTLLLLFVGGPLAVSAEGGTPPEEYGTRWRWRSVGAGLAVRGRAQTRASVSRDCRGAVALPCRGDAHGVGHGVTEARAVAVMGAGGLTVEGGAVRVDTLAVADRQYASHGASAGVVKGAMHWLEYSPEREDELILDLVSQLLCRS